MARVTRWPERIVACSTKEAAKTFAEDLAAWALREPHRFSPNVTLRAVVQIFLLPTVAYYGAAAEIDYFAQTAEFIVPSAAGNADSATRDMTLAKDIPARPGTLRGFGCQISLGIDHVLRQGC